MKDIDKYLKDFLFRVGSGVAQVAKEKNSTYKNRQSQKRYKGV